MKSHCAAVKPPFGVAFVVALQGPEGERPKPQTRSKIIKKRQGFSSKLEIMVPEWTNGRGTPPVCSFCVDFFGQTSRTLGHSNICHVFYTFSYFDRRFFVFWFFCFFPKHHWHWSLFGSENRRLTDLNFWAPLRFPVQFRICFVFFLFRPLFLVFLVFDATCLPGAPEVVPKGDSRTLPGAPKASENTPFCTLVPKW